MTRRCGTCRHTERASDAHVFCIGAPPTVMDVQLGEDGTTSVRSQSPILHADRKACALHKLRWQWPWKRPAR